LLLEHELLKPVLEKAAAPMVCSISAKLWPGKFVNNGYK